MASEVLTYGGRESLYRALHSFFISQGLKADNSIAISWSQILGHLILKATRIASIILDFKHTLIFISDFSGNLKLFFRFVERSV